VRYLALCALSLLSWPLLASEDAWRRERAALVEEIRNDVRSTYVYTGIRRLDERVLEVIGTVPRHEFVPESHRRSAYENRPLPIGHGQTISQPYIVALMTDVLEPEAGKVMLEVGTGSGYQAAVLADLVESVYTVEIIEPLARSASARLERLGYDNVEVRHGDGYYGWPEHAPFDGIIVTAVGSRIPPPLIEQLKPGGIMILPVGGRFTAQHLVLVTKDAEGAITTREILPVSFVPLTGGH
jgi:protein-L-isoaspartate(D-aspartate) O-methyltransferase